MIEAITILFTYNHKEKASRYLSMMRNDNHFSKNPIYQKEIDQFVLDSLAGDMKFISTQKAETRVKILIMNSLQSLCIGDREKAKRFEILAIEVYKKYADFLKQ